MRSTRSPGARAASWCSSLPRMVRGGRGGGEGHSQALPPGETWAWGAQRENLPGSGGSENARARGGGTVAKQCAGRPGEALSALRFLSPAIPGAQGCFLGGAAGPPKVGQKGAESCFTHLLAKRRC